MFKDTLGINNALADINIVKLYKDTRQTRVVKTQINRCRCR